VRYWLGFDNLVDCTPKYLEQVRETFAKFDVGIHTHLNETHGRIAATVEKFGDLPTCALEMEGVLGRRTVVAHCIHLEPEEKAILQRTGTSIVHNPVSNMRLGNGAAPIAEMMERGVNVCLGTDGMLSAYKLDHFETMRIAAMLQRVTRHDCQVLPAWRVLEMATINGARALGLENEIGSLQAGKRADLIVLDANAPHMTPRARGGHGNLATLLVYAAHGSDVETVLVDGEIVVKDRKLTRVDETVVRDDAQAASDRILAGVPSPPSH
jgi:5-methylthioadenosine/S-adenosylhomocysteine deaminase